MNLVIDVGNTVVKLSVFDGDKLTELVREGDGEFALLPALCARHACSAAIISTVRTLDEEDIELINSLQIPVLWMTPRTPVPLENWYETPDTLGCDRLAAVVGAHTLFPGRDLLVIDAGTCVTYEWVDARGRYWGGNISPGVQMRFSALHRFTGRLPMVQAEGRCLSIGRDTETAMRAGVLIGLRHEMRGYIHEKRARHPGLQVVLTGGDAARLSEGLDEAAIIDPILVLRGLNSILRDNLRRQTDAISLPQGEHSVASAR